MKARTLVSMLCISLMCITGFGNTTTDLTENSTADIVQMDSSVSVEMINVESPAIFQVVDHKINKYLDVGIAFAIKTDAQLATRFKALFKEAEPGFNKEYGNLINKLLDVGWNTNYNSLQTLKKNKDLGGVLLLFYTRAEIEI